MHCNFSANGGKKVSLANKHGVLINIVVVQRTAIFPTTSFTLKIV